MMDSFLHHHDTICGGVEKGRKERKAGGVKKKAANISISIILF